MADEVQDVVVPRGSAKQCTFKTVKTGLHGLGLTYRHAIRLLSGTSTISHKVRSFLDPIQRTRWSILDAIHLQAAPRLRMGGVISPVPTCLHSTHSTF